MLVNLTTYAIESILTNNQLKIIIWIFPEDSAIFSGNGEQFADCGAGKVKCLVTALQISCSPPVGPPVLSMQIIPKCLEQLRVIIRCLSPDIFTGFCIQACQECPMLIDIDPPVFHTEGTAIDTFSFPVAP